MPARTHCSKCLSPTQGSGQTLFEVEVSLLLLFETRQQKTRSLSPNTFKMGQGREGPGTICPRIGGSLCAAQDQASSSVQGGRARSNSRQSLQAHVRPKPDSRGWTLRWQSGARPMA